MQKRIGLRLGNSSRNMKDISCCHSVLIIMLMIIKMFIYLCRCYLSGSARYIKIEVYIYKVSQEHDRRKLMMQKYIYINRILKYRNLKISWSPYIGNTNMHTHIQNKTQNINIGNIPINKEFIKYFKWKQYK